MNIKARYKLNKSSKTNTELICPSCGTAFIKTHYAQAFCKTKSGTKCKDKYWNTVIPEKRCNTTRISPASRAFMETRDGYRSIESLDEDHPFSSEGLGQWID
jgi:hypothetical protein